MKVFIKLTAALLIAASYAQASSGASGDEGSFLVNLFLAFGAIIIVFQLIPGLVLFSSMIKAVFSPSPKKGENATEP
jgi:hypothetical protein